MSDTAHEAHRTAPEETQPIDATNSNAVPAPAAEPAAESAVVKPEPADAVTPTANPEPAAEPAAEVTPAANPEPAAEPADAVTPTANPEPAAEPADKASEATTPEAGAETGTPPVFKMGDDVSAYTGRPRFTAEENKALAQSSRFLRQAMTTAARARGEEYEPFQLPAKMRAELAKIDAEAAQLKYEEALKAGKSEQEAQALKNSSYATLAQLHAVDPAEDEEQLKQRREEDRVAAGGARFYHKYQELLERQQAHQAANKAKIKNNLKIAVVVIIGLIGYMAYNQFAVDKDASSIAELKAALPLNIDETTALVRIDDRNDDFRLFFEKDPKAFAGWDEHQKQAALDQFSKNAPLLCKNQLLNHIITSGKKVTVILEATDRSFSRQYAVDQCPTSAQ